MKSKIPSVEERWCWPQGMNDQLCECINCRRMGMENEVHMGNVDAKLPLSSFYHKGKWVPQYYHIYRYMPEYMNTTYHPYYSREQLLPS